MSAKPRARRSPASRQHHNPVQTLSGAGGRVSKAASGHVDKRSHRVAAQGPFVLRREGESEARPARRVTRCASARGRRNGAGTNGKETRLERRGT